MKNRALVSWTTFGLITLIWGSLQVVAGRVLVAPLPSGEAASPDYEVAVNGKPVPVYTAKSVHGGDYSFASFDFTGTAKVVVKGRSNLASAVVRPLSAGIQLRPGKGFIQFKLNQPRKLSIEPDGIRGPLLLFANAPEQRPVQSTDANVVYFGPGVHKPNLIVLKSGQTLYLAAGAVVKAAVRAEKAENIRICGRGILDGTDWPWLKGPAGHMVGLTDCRNVTVEGIVIRGSFAWTVVPMRCENVTVRNVKLVNSRVQNDDGINPCNSQHVLIEDCFIRSDDDCVAVKGLRHLNTPPTPARDITVRRCIFWCDRARIFLFAHESQASAMEDLVYEDCDIVHYTMTPFLLEPGEHMPLRRLRFENFRIEGEGQRDFVTLRPTINQYMKVQAPGSIEDVLFRNIQLVGKQRGEARVWIQGTDEQHQVRNVRFEQVSRYGEELRLGAPHLNIGGFAEDIRFGKN